MKLISPIYESPKGFSINIKNITTLNINDQSVFVNGIEITHSNKADALDFYYQLNRLMKRFC